MDYKSKEQVNGLAIRYGCALMRQVTKVSCGVDESIDTWESWTHHLFAPRTPINRAMRSIWTEVSNRDAGQPTVAYVPLRLMSLCDVDGNHQLLQPEPVAQSGAVFDEAAKILGKGFVKHLMQSPLQSVLPQGQIATDKDFDRFYFLMQKYASTLPCTYGERSVSLFRQWCMVTALIAITEGQVTKELPSLAIIGVDLPGIQNMVYTITARGAGKGVRGRSAFVQLLISAVVDRLLDEFSLCRSNVIVNGGGNAMILCRKDDELEAKLARVEKSINAILLNGDNHQRPFAGFKGDLALAMAYVDLPSQALSYPAQTIIEQDSGKSLSLWQQYEKALKEAVTRAKQQPFHLMSKTDDGFAQLFRPDVAVSDRFCVVCRRPEDLEGEFVEDDELPESGPGIPGAICPECKGFEELAAALAKPNIFLNRYDATANGAKTQGQGDKNAEFSAWQEALNEVSGRRYWYAIKEAADSAAHLCLTLHLDEFVPEHPEIDGFLLMATTSPTKKNPNYGQDLGAREYVIRDNSELADDTQTSLKRLGVLKADVDDLAKLLVDGLPHRSAAQTAVLSDSLALFFGGWLERLCQQMGTNENDERNTRIYVLYAGGDDLLIIGSWEVMPLLAQRIARDFEAFTGKNPGVHLSAGLVLVGGKEPLYAAVESADEELDIAKQKNLYGQAKEKNAITFLGKRYNWQDFEQVVAWQERLVALRKSGAPSSLLGALLTIYTQYCQNRGEIYGIPARGKYGIYEANNEYLYLGPWIWKLIYRLDRFGRGQDFETQVNALRCELLKPGGVERMSVSARWAQFLTRRGEGSET